MFSLLSRRPSRPIRRRSLPRLEALEVRTMPAVATPFTPRFSANAPGDIAIIGNTLETASTVNNPGRTAADVTATQNGVAGPNGNNVNNNNWNMAYVDVDNNPTTFDSSLATLSLPAGSTVLFAGLYWGSVTTTPAQAAARNTVKFSTPASGGYVSLTGTTIGSFNFTGTPPGSIYESFADVTSLVQAAGTGTYALANVQAALTDANGNLPYMGSYAGWSLVVAYSAPGTPERNLTVFDGYAVQQSTDSPLDIPISGFIAPPSGTVNAKVGVVSYEGDLGTTGDSMALNGKPLSDAATPANNFFNSGISNLGVPVTAKDPDYVNQMGFDAKIVQAPNGAIPNGATSATVTLSTSGEGYFPGVVTTAIDLYAPNLVDTKSVTDVTSGGARSSVAPGDVLRYTVNVTNNGLDPAGDVVLTDAIPANTTYVPGSLQIVSGANTGSKSDAAGDDQASFNALGNDVVFQLGTGANASSGGTLAINASAEISFEVQVDPGTPANTVIANQATTAFTGVTTGLKFTSLSNLVFDLVLGLNTTPNPATVTLGPNPVTLTDTADLEGGYSPTGTLTFTLTGPGGTTVDTETVPVSGDGTYTTPTGFTLPSSGTVTGTYQWDVTYSGDGNNNPASATLMVTARVGVLSPTTDPAHVSADQFDPDPSNDTSDASPIGLSNNSSEASLLGHMPPALAGQVGLFFVQAPLETLSLLTAPVPAPSPLPPSPSLTALVGGSGEAEYCQLSGYAYLDRNNDGFMQATEPGIPNVRVTLTGTTTVGEMVSRSTSTDRDGYYLFDDLAPGTYAVAVVQPGGFLDGQAAVGRVNGAPAGRVVDADNIAQILLPRNGVGTEYNFGKLRQVRVSGYMYEDVSQNCKPDVGEPDCANSTVVLTGKDDRGSDVTRTTSTADGGQAGGEEASDGRPEVEARDDFFTQAGEDTDLLGGASGLLSLSLLATAAAVVAFDQAARQAQARLDPQRAGGRLRGLRRGGEADGLALQNEEVAVG